EDGIRDRNVTGVQTCALPIFDPAFPARYLERNAGEYLALVEQMAAGLFDRDTVPGPSPEELLALELQALVVPGHDSSHATSAAQIGRASWRERERLAGGDVSV